MNIEELRKLCPDCNRFMKFIPTPDKQIRWYCDYCEFFWTVIKAIPG